MEQKNTIKSPILVTRKVYQILLVATDMYTVPTTFQCQIQAS